MVPQVGFPLFLKVGGTFAILQLLDIVPEQHKLSELIESGESWLMPLSSIPWGGSPSGARDMQSLVSPLSLAASYSPLRVLSPSTGARQILLVMTKKAMKTSALSVSASTVLPIVLLDKRPQHKQAVIHV